MTMTERLLEATKEIWDGYNETPFVKGIADGSLDHEKFKYYMIQDYLIFLTIQRHFPSARRRRKTSTQCACSRVIPIRSWTVRWIFTART